MYKTCITYPFTCLWTFGMLHHLALLNNAEINTDDLWNFAFNYSAYIGEGRAPPLQYFCLENPMDGGACSPWGRSESDRTERIHFHFSLSCTGEGNGNPLQCSCLENPGDSGAWWAAIYGVAQSQTRLKRLSSSSSILHIYSEVGLLDHIVILIWIFRGTTILFYTVATLFYSPTKSTQRFQFLHFIDNTLFSLSLFQ